MKNVCEQCHRPTNPSYDRIESLLIDGVPERPESRSTKQELWDEIRSLRSLLADLRVTLLQAYATEIDIKATDHRRERRDDRTD